MPVNRPWDQIFTQTCTIQRQVDEPDSYGEPGGIWANLSQNIRCLLVEQRPLSPIGITQLSLSSETVSGSSIAGYHLIIDSTIDVEENDRVTNIVDIDNPVTADERKFIVLTALKRVVPGIEHKLCQIKLVS